MKKKVLAIVLCVAIVACGAIAGTLAYLNVKTDTVKNTFTAGNVKIDLAETTGTEYKMIPGYEITKDPTVTVEKGSEKCYLFVKLDESSDFATYLEYTVDSSWTKLDGETNVYYQVVESNTTADQTFAVLSGNKVTVKGDVNFTGSEAPTLSVTAYASQYNKSNDVAFTAAEAWANVTK